MSILIALSALPEAIGKLLARAGGWSPIGRAVTVLIEISDDPYLVGRSVSGTVRGLHDRSGTLLIQLQELLTCREEESFVDLVVARPVLRWHGPARLLVSWTAVQVVHASSFSMLEDVRPIGTGRLTLQRRNKRG